MKTYFCEQYSPTWWALRRGFPTASEFDSIIMPKKMELSTGHKGYIARLIGDLLDPIYPNTDDKATAAMKRGTLLEPQARALYELWNDDAVQQVGMCFDDSGRFGCSPDALVGTDGILELKSPTPAVHAAWVIDGELPSDYRPQCHGHLVVTGRAWCDFMSYLPGSPPFIVRVVRDEFTAKLETLLEEFDRRYIEALVKFGLSRPRQEAP